MAAETAVTAPPLHLLGAEPLRAIYHYVRTRLRHRKPRRADGDGHLVVLFPGLATDDRFIEPLRRHCQRLGYDARGWGRGLNGGPQGDPDAWMRRLAAETAALATARGHRSVSLIGWSLGGIYAREIAKLMPRRVRRVITIGTPIARLTGVTHAEWLFRWLNPRAPIADADLERRIRTPPPVPATAIYSRSDGVVAWQACRHDPAPWVDNVEVESSHFGLAWHPQVLDIVADRLRQRRRRIVAPRRRR